jgi:hypothetical protein
MISKLAELSVRLFKLGIVSREQLTADHLEGLLNSHKFIALDLYNGLDGLPEDEVDKIQERALSWFRVQNGVLKNSRAHRFDSFDHLSFSVIAEKCSSHREVRVHDIGASDGRASCVLYHLLNQRFAERLHFMATDSTPYLSVLKRARGRSRLIVDDQQNVLQVIMPPFVLIVIRRPTSKRQYYLNPMIHLAMFFYARPVLKDYKSGSPNVQQTRLELLCPQCRSLIRQRRNFRFSTYDVLSGPTEHFDVIRAMNLLNRSYFSEVQLTKALENIFESLTESGLFITGSNDGQETAVNGGIYKKAGNRLERIETSGAGSQLNALISNLRVAHDLKPSQIRFDL